MTVLKTNADLMGKREPELDERDDRILKLAKKIGFRPAEVEELERLYGPWLEK